MVRKKVLKIKGMHCASCATIIEKKLKKVSGVINANVNFATEKATIEFQVPYEIDEDTYDLELNVEGDDEKGKNQILKSAKTKDVALLVIGDPMSATTHVDLLLRCKKLGIKIEVIHNASIINAVGIVGLELYKYGKTTSIPFPEKNFQPETAYDVIKMNKKNGLHTLCLLDLRPLENKFMSVNDAIKILLDIGEKRKAKGTEKTPIFTKNTFCIGCARIGSDNLIKAGKAEKLLKENFGAPSHCLIVPAKMHFVEEDALKMWK